MIKLVIPARAEARDRYVVRLNDDASNCGGPMDASLVSDNGNSKIYSGEHGLLELTFTDESDLDGDVVCVDGTNGFAERLIRARSQHNTFLVTERCDQLCIMCSQPPKNTHVDRWQEFLEAARLAPTNALLGISGGEPTLYKRELFDLILQIGEERPDISWHVLSNAQHFEAQDIDILGSARFRNVTWGIPIYAADSGLHDEIVGKVGAYRTLKGGLAILLQAGARIELRTVLLSSNVNQISALGHHIGLHLTFCDQWSIMQLEATGFAKNRFGALYAQTLEHFAPVSEAIDAAELYGLPVVLFNFARCQVPQSYRSHAVASISDWKRKYAKDCDTCHEKHLCGGFFEWHPASSMEVSPL